MQRLFRVRFVRRRVLHSTLALCVLGWVGLASALPLTPARAAAGPHEIAVLGDSLSAEYGLERGTGWVALLAHRLAEDHAAWTVRNASISGDTTAGGLARLPALLKTRPGILVIELGANDALRGLPLADTRRNLESMVGQAHAAGARVLLVGIQVPPNYGRAYTSEFARIFTEVAASGHTPLVPFMLAGVADRPDAQDWFQADGLHPLARAHPIILDNIWPALKPLLGS